MHAPSAWVAAAATADDWGMQVAPSLAIAHNCHAQPLNRHAHAQDASGKAHDWGEQPWGNVFGAEGWCSAEKPKWHCPCIIDGLAGETCDEVGGWAKK